MCQFLHRIHLKLPPLEIEIFKSKIHITICIIAHDPNTTYYAKCTIDIFTNALLVLKATFLFMVILSAKL